MAIQILKLARMDSGWADAAIQHGLEGASQTFTKGAILTASSGTLVQPATFTGNITGVVGVSLANATGTTNADCPYICAMPGTIWVASVDGALSSSNAPATGKPSDLVPYTTYYGMSLDAASGNWYVNSAITPAAEGVIVLGWDPDQASVIQGLVYFRFRFVDTIY